MVRIQSFYFSNFSLTGSVSAFSCKRNPDLCATQLFVSPFFYYFFSPFSSCSDTHFLSLLLFLSTSGCEEKCWDRLHEVLVG